MIRHRPEGRGHAYLVEPDQRVPTQPVAGNALELRATTGEGVGELWLDLERQGVTERIEASRVSPLDEVVRTAQTTHLSAAADGTGRGRRPEWKVVLDGLSAGERVRYRFAGADGSQTRWHETVTAEWSPTGGTLASTPETDRLVAESVSWLTVGSSVKRVRFALRIEPDDHVVGFGERFDALDQRGHALDTVVFEQYKGQGARTYLPMPFAIIVGSGWGFHVATSRRVWFDVGRADERLLWIEADLDGEAHLALEFFSGSAAEVLAAFLERTGRPVLPPDWAFEPWMSANDWNTQQRVLDEVRRGAAEDIPVGVLVIEAWSDESTFTAFRDAVYEPHADGAPHTLSDFSFPSDGAWPDPKGLVDELHDRGIRLLLWQIPLLKVGPAPGSQLDYDRRALVDHGYAVLKIDGTPYANRGWWFPRALMPDFTSAEARAWWAAKRRYLVEELGVDGFKTDGGEHAWGNDLRYADGTRGAESNNRYPVLYAAAYHELMRGLGREGMTFSRAGFTGSAAYPCHWAGDEDSTWDAFRASITAGLTAGACGIFFWGWDIAGFSGELPTAELYMRSAAAACFAPIMQYHSEYHHREPSRDRTPWNVAEQTGDPRVLEVYRRFAKLRMRLQPYLQAQARLSVSAGKPLMRALFFEVADDARIWDFPHEYFLGDDLIVAPVIEPGAEEQRVYLPRGEWVDPWTDDELIGPTVVTRPAPLDRIPVYVSLSGAAMLAPLFKDEGEGRVLHAGRESMEVS
ncbi:MAG TPA: TIM-barrel domain-containing protein [Gaiellaceae bacterium]